MNAIQRRTSCTQENSLLPNVDVIFTIFTNMELLSLYQYTVVVGGAHMIVSGVYCNSIDDMLW